MKIRKVLTVMLCTLIIVAVFAVAVPRNAGAANPVTIYVDMSGIDDRADLTPEQRQQLKEWIIWDIQWNFDNSVGPGKVEVTMDSAKKAGSARQVRITNDTGTDGTDYWYGEWNPRKPTETKVHLQNFLDRHGDDYKDGGVWNITKLRRGIGRTCSHELGHSFCIGHNNDTGDTADKMTENVTSARRANQEWVFDWYSKKVLENNLGIPFCYSAKDYDKWGLVSHFYNGPFPIQDPDDRGSVDALFNFSGPLADQFELGWYGVDTDNGVYDGSSEFNFIYKTSMLADPEQNAEMLTFFEGITDKVQFLLRGAPGSLWEGYWFPLNDTNVALEDFIETPNHDVVARKVSMGWNVDGDPGLDVQITFDAANAFGNYTCPYNGFTYEYMPAPDIIITNVVPSKTVVGQGYSLNISVTISNPSSNASIIPVAVAVYANTTIIEARYIFLSPEGSATITFTWNTTGFAKGQYTISASAWIFSGGETNPPAVLTDGDVQITILCDLNGDHSCDMADISMMIDWFMASHPEYDANCDVNDDLTIDMADISIAIDNFMIADP